jgi:glycerol-3-phosphate acyltransferase PlsY
MTIAGITFSYLLGAFPTAYLAGRLLKGVDIRKFGSGNVGATNALRVLGKGPGIIVLLVDVLKGVLAVTVLGDFITAHNASGFPGALPQLFCGIAAVTGHNWPVFLGFKGGKGVATTLGVLVGLALRVHGLGWILGLTLLTWTLVFTATRIVSISSVAAGILLPVYLVIFRFPALWIVAGSVFGLLGVFRHRGNIARFFKGREKKIF